MPHCSHKPPEASRGDLDCDIRAEIKNRNGLPRWWCHVHGQEAWRPDGTAMDRCAGAFFDAIDDCDVADVDLAATHVGMWGALAPAIAIGVIDEEPTGVHVHTRGHGAADKSTDATFQMVRVRHGDHEMEIGATQAVAFSISQLLDQPLVVLRCPKTECGELHLDELHFATFGHRKHQCNACGRPFYDQAPSTSNPLADAHARLGLPPRAAPTRPARTVSLRSDEYGGIAIWPSNPSIIWNSDRGEDVGLHVHAWDLTGELSIDETYATVTLDGHRLDETDIGLLCVLRELAESPEQVTAVDCSHCGAGLVSRPTGTAPLAPSTRHHCHQCGSETRTTRRRLVHPLAEPAR